MCAISDKVILASLNSSAWYQTMAALGGGENLVSAAAKFILDQTRVNTTTSIVATRLDKLVSGGMLEVRGGQLVLTDAAFDQYFGRKFDRRPASLARLQTEGVGIDAIYKRGGDDCLDGLPTCFGGEPSASRDPWRQQLARVWLALAPIEEVIALACQGAPEVEYYGFPQELASLEQNGGGRHVLAAPACA